MIVAWRQQNYRDSSGIENLGGGENKRRNKRRHGGVAKSISAAISAIAKSSAASAKWQSPKISRWQHLIGIG